MGLLIPIISFKSKKQVMHEQKFKDPQVTHANLAQKGEHWTWNERFMRGPSSIYTGVTFATDFFCFRLVKPLMPILALLPISSSL